MNTPDKYRRLHPAGPTIGQRLLTLALTGLLLVAVFMLGATSAHAADLRTRHCNPYTYGRPHSCHVAPVQTVGGTLNKCVTIDGRLVCFRYYAWR